jgi:hypothetical protein
MSLFRSKEPPPRAPIQVVLSTSIRLEQWQNSPELVEFAKALFRDPRFQTMLSVLRTESPSNYGLATGSSHDDQIAHSYKGAGYNLCLNTLESLAEYVKHPEHLEATFEPEKPPPLPHQPQ